MFPLVQILDARQREYYLFVGYFISKYAMLEHLLRNQLKYLTKSTDEQFSVLIGYPRSGDLIKKVRQFAKIYGLNEEASAAVEDAFEHLAEITKLRDRLVHYGVHVGMIGPSSVLKRGGKVDELGYDDTDIENLWNAVEDLELIYFVFVNRLDTEINRPDWGLAHNGIRHGPWKYKPL